MTGLLRIQTTHLRGSMPAHRLAKVARLLGRDCSKLVMPAVLIASLTLCTKNQKL